MTFSNREKIRWHYVASCPCSRDVQDQANAFFYNQRGRFHFQRRDFEHALTYMREAFKLALTNKEYFDDYCMTLVAVRQRDPTPEEYYMLGVDVHNAFRSEYAIMRSRGANIAALQERIREVLGQAQLKQQSLSSGWAYSNVTPSVAELPATRFEMRPASQMYELGECDDSSQLESETSLSNTKSGKRRVLWNWR